MKRVTKYDKCEYPDCNEKAMILAADYKDKVGKYCYKHARIKAQEGKPEYVVGCPNCHCNFGTNQEIFQFSL